MEDIKNKKNIIINFVILKNNFLLRHYKLRVIINFKVSQHILLSFPRQKNNF